MYIYVSHRFRIEDIHTYIHLIVHTQVFNKLQQVIQTASPEK